MSDPIHRGKSTHRWKDNPLEKRFAVEWEKKNENDFTGTLGYLMGDGNRPGPIDGRDALVAATVVQWLGSHVGQCFLAEVLSDPQAKDLRTRLIMELERKKHETVTRRKKLEPSEDIDD